MTEEGFLSKQIIAIRAEDHGILLFEILLQRLTRESLLELLQQVQLLIDGMHRLHSRVDEVLHTVLEGTIVHGELDKVTLEEGVIVVQQVLTVLLGLLTERI